jgi:hypothetical protein
LVCLVGSEMCIRDSYWGSSEELLKDIETLGKESFTREIVKLCLTRGNVNYSELEEQFKRNVLGALNESGSRIYYNTNVATRYFVSTVLTTSEKAELHRRKNRKLLAGTGSKKTKKSK